LFRIVIDGRIERTLQVTLEGILGGLGTVLGLEPDETELVLNVVNHNLTTFSTTLIIATLSGRVGSLELEVLVRLLEVLPAVALVENTVDGLDVVGVREDLVTRDDILYKTVC
jgi:hypothetical protein